MEPSLETVDPRSPGPNRTPLIKRARDLSAYDPRSPSEGIRRSPILVHESLVEDAESSELYLDEVMESAVKIDSYLGRRKTKNKKDPSATSNTNEIQMGPIDPRSPRPNRTPLMGRQNDLSPYDPRSPSQGIRRTPILIDRLFGKQSTPPGTLSTSSFHLPIQDDYSGDIPAYIPKESYLSSIGSIAARVVHLVPTPSVESFKKGEGSSEENLGEKMASESYRGRREGMIKNDPLFENREPIGPFCVEFAMKKWNSTTRSNTAEAETPIGPTDPRSPRPNRTPLMARAKKPDNDPRSPTAGVHRTPIMARAKKPDNDPRSPTAGVHRTPIMVNRHFGKSDTPPGTPSTASSQSLIQDDNCGDVPYIAKENSSSAIATIETYAGHLVATLMNECLEKDTSGVELDGVMVSAARPDPYHGQRKGIDKNDPCESIVHPSARKRLDF